jgi:hypothetical protein
MLMHLGIQRQLFARSERVKGELSHQLCDHTKLTRHRNW